MKVTPSNLKVLKEKLKDFEGVNIPSEINEKEANHVHVVLIRSRQISPTKIKHNAIIQKYRLNAWEGTIKQRINAQGYGTVEILHHPEMVEAVVADDFNEMKAKAKSLGMEVSNTTTKVEVEEFLLEKEIEAGQ